MHALLFTMISTGVFVRAFVTERRRIRQHGATPLEDIFRHPAVVLDLLVLLLPRLVRKLWAAGLLIWVSVALVVVHFSFLIYVSQLQRIHVTDVAIYVVLLLSLAVSGSNLATFTISGRHPR